MQPLAEPAMEAVVDGRIRFVPERFAKVYLNWMENIRDWCISRQLWWGHRIPVWYCQDCGKEIVAAQEPSLYRRLWELAVEILYPVIRLLTVFVFAVVDAVERRRLYGQ